jgi:histone H3/H4
MSFLILSNVKDALDENNVSADFYDALNAEVAELLEDAARRTESNNRQTVQPPDL